VSIYIAVAVDAAVTVVNDECIDDNFDNTVVGFGAGGEFVI